MSKTENTATPAEVGTEGPKGFLNVRDLRVHFPTDDGLVKSVDGLSSTWRRARPSASWASPAPASP